MLCRGGLKASTVGAPPPSSIQSDSGFSLRRSPTHSFEESRIRFPPSYRRKRGAEGDCGDYTDTARVSNAFTTQLVVEKRVEISGVRPPSYTDRILAHSLEDRKELLRKGPYELCDAVRGSDHRPVSQAFFLKVNAALAGEKTIADLIPMRLLVSAVRWICFVWLSVCICICRCISRLGSLLISPTRKTKIHR